MSARRKPAPVWAPNPWARYSVQGLDAAERQRRRPSRAALAHFVREAAREQGDAAARLADPAWIARASDMSLTSAREAVAASVHALARQRLEYARMRAFACNRVAGSYAPLGYPIDRPAREAWARLNPDAFA